MLISAVLMIALGVLSLIFPLIAGITAEVFYGALLLTAGVIHISSVFRSGGSDTGSHLFISVIFFAMGLLLLFFPMFGLFSIALITGVGFFVQGVIQIAYVFSRGVQSSRWMIGLSGVIGAVAGGIILYGWPFDSAWVFGVVLGVNLVFLGFSILALRNAIEHAAPIAS